MDIMLKNRDKSPSALNSIVVTGAAGFTGYSVTKELSSRGYKVYAVVRPHSNHNQRLRGLKNVIIIQLESKDISNLSSIVQDNPIAMIHLSWEGNRYNSKEQSENIRNSISALESASKIGCRKFFCTGSQAEYGATRRIQVEDDMPRPFCAYGAAKVATCYLTKNRADELGIEWVWGRVFSLYGLYEPSGRMLPDVVRALANNESEIRLSSCKQNWDYLNVKDAAEAIISLVERGNPGEIYNIANGSYKQLREYVDIAYRLIDSKSRLLFGDDPAPFVSLQPSVEKIYNDTGWKAKIPFEEGIKSEIELGYS